MASVPATRKMNWKLFFIICCLRKFVYTSEVTESLIGKSAYDDEHLIRTIKETLLIAPNTEKSYNLTDDKNNDKSQFGQDEIVAKLFSQQSSWSSNPHNQPPLTTRYDTTTTSPLTTNQK